MGLMPVFGGLNVAITTPFNDEGDIDTILFGMHVQQLIARGAEGIVYLGTTGEGAYLAPEKAKGLYAPLLNFRKGNPEIKLICGFVKPTVEDILFQAESVYEDTADAFLVAPPFNEPMGAEGVIRLFKDMAQLGKPLIAYNIPQETGFRFTASFLQEIYDETKGALVGVKDSAPNVALLNRFFRMYSNKGEMPIQFLQGNDRNLAYALKALRLLKTRGNYPYELGSISGASSFSPIAELEVAIHKLVGNGDCGHAERIQGYLNKGAFDVFELAKEYGGEQPIIKVMISAIMGGMYPANVSVGLTMPADPNLQRIVDKAYEIDRVVREDIVGRIRTKTMSIGQPLRRAI